MWGVVGGLGGGWRGGGGVAMHLMRSNLLHKFVSHTYSTFQALSGHILMLTAR